MTPLSLLAGALVGLSLGLTGGGGAIFAVPLLVYGFGCPPREAVGVSLIAVGVTSLLGFLHRWRSGDAELATGAFFAVAGMLGAPIGTWLADRLPDAALLLSFAALMVVVATRMWQQSLHPILPTDSCPPSKTDDGPACQRDRSGRLILTSRCARLLLVIGAMTGVLSGLFGVGGGFVIVPALVLFSGMSMQRAIGTSLMVISLVSASGIASQLWAGRTIPIGLATSFVLGGVVGLYAGQRVSRALPAWGLQRLFAVAILAVAVFIILRHTTHY